MGKKRVLADRACEGCGNLFRPRLAVTRFCSIACKSSARVKTKKSCLQCHIEFEPASAQQKFCSHACGAASHRADRKVVCQWCKTEFERPHGKARAFCSRSCSMRARGAGLVANYADLPPRELTPDGYYYTRDGYKARKVNGVQVFEHRLVMEQIIGRPLMPGERVHHRNGNRQDNRPENLELWTGVGQSKKDPHGVRLVDLVLDMIESLTKTERAKVLRRLEELNA